MNKKGFGLIGILVVIGIVAIFIVAGVLIIGDKDGATSFEEQVDWKTYRNDEYGFEINTPADWVIEKLPYDNRICFKSSERIEFIEENKRNCSGVGSGTCLSELNSCDIYFSDESSLAYASEETMNEETLNGVSFSTFNELGMVDLFTYETTNNESVYNFTLASSEPKDEYARILSTFKFIDE